MGDRTQRRWHLWFFLGMGLLAAALGSTLTNAQGSYFFNVQTAIPLDVSTDAGPQAITLADVDDDGEADLIAVNEDNSSISVLLSNGDGTFEDPVDFDLDDDPSAVVVDDVASPFDSEEAGDIDGVPDIVVANLGGTFSILVGLGDGDFELRDEDLDFGFEFIGLALGDFDGNTRLDLAGLDLDGEVYLACNDRGVFAVCPTELFETGGGEDVLAIAAGDFNGDRNTDLAVLTASTVFIHNGNGNGEFPDEPRSISTTVGAEANDARDLAVADLDDDENTTTDIVVVNNGEFDNLQALGLYGPNQQGAGRRTFTAPTNALAIALADLDGNRFSDAIVVNEDGDPGILPDDAGGGGFGDNPLPLFRLGAARAVAVGDFAGDSLPDVVTLNLDGNEVHVAVNVSNDATPTPGTPSPGVSTPTRSAGPTGTPTPTVPTNTPTATPTSTAIPTAPLSRCEIRIPVAGQIVAPVAVEAGDLNGDANPDLAVADGRNGQVLVVLIDPIDMPLPDESENCFVNLAPRVFDVPGTPAALAVGSLNVLQNSTLDVAVVGSTGLSILLGDGQGNLGSAVTMSVGDDPRSVAISDFDRDGRPDIAVANRGSNNVVVLYGRGDGTFEDPVTIADETNGRPTFVLATDLNNDTFPDLAVASEDARTVTVYYRETAMARKFRVIPVINLSGAPTGLEAADFNKDGLVDLAAGVRASDGSGSFVVLTAVRNAGEVLFQVSTPFAAGRRPAAIGVGDFNRDVRMDVVVANFADNTANFYLGSTSAVFMPLNPTAVNQGPVALVVDDFDADAKLDVVTADRDGGTLTILRSSVPPSTPTPLPSPTVTQTGTVTPTNTPTSTPAQTGTATPTPFGTATQTGTRTRTDTPTQTPKEGAFALSSGGCAVIPPDGSGGGRGSAASLLLAGILLWRRRRAAIVCAIAALLTAGSAGAQTPMAYLRCDRPLAGGVAPSALASADFDNDNDGSPDLAIIDRVLASVSVLLTDGSSLAIASCDGGTQTSVAVDSDVFALDVVNLGDDADLDLAVAQRRGAGVLTNDGSGTFVAQTFIDLGVDVDPRSIVAGDFDGDGRTDLAVGTSDSNSIEILYGLPGGGFEERATSFPIQQSADALAAADFNRDGRLDLVALSTFSGTALVLLRDADNPRSFRAMAPFSVGTAPTGLAVANFDGDVVDDIAFSVGGDDQLAIFFGTLSGSDVTFAERFGRLSTGNLPAAVVTADFNRDGRTDAATANELASSVSFFQGIGGGELELVDWCPGPTDGLAGACRTGTGPRALAVALLDGDALPDLIVGNAGGTGSLSFFFSTNPPLTPTPSETASPSVTPTATETRTFTETPTFTPTSTPTGTPNPTRTPNPSRTVTQTASPSPGGPFAVQGSCAVVDSAGGSGAFNVLAIAALLGALGWRGNTRRR